MSAAQVRYVEGVPYYKFKVSYQLTDGKRRRMTHWSPGAPWVRTEVSRTLDARVGIENIKAKSVVIREVAQ